MVETSVHPSRLLSEKGWQPRADVHGQASTPHIGLRYGGEDIVAPTHWVMNAMMSNHWVMNAMMSKRKARFSGGFGSKRNPIQGEGEASYIHINRIATSRSTEQFF